MKKLIKKSNAFVRNNLVGHPLVIMVLAIASLFGLLRAYHAYGVHANFDADILLFIASVFSLVLAFMVSRTRWNRWTILSAGLVATFLGDALLYTSFALAHFGREMYFQDYVLTLIRAAFIIGGIFVIVGMGQEWWSERHENRLKQSRFSRWFRHPKRSKKEREYFDNDISQVTERPKGE